MITGTLTQRRGNRKRSKPAQKNLPTTTRNTTVFCTVCTVCTTSKNTWKDNRSVDELSLRHGGTCLSCRQKSPPARQGRSPQPCRVFVSRPRPAAHPSPTMLQNHDAILDSVETLRNGIAPLLQVRDSAFKLPWKFCHHLLRKLRQLSESRNLFSISSTRVSNSRIAVSWSSSTDLTATLAPAPCPEPMPLVVVFVPLVASSRSISTKTPAPSGASRKASPPTTPPEGIQAVRNEQSCRARRRCRQAYH